VFVNNKWVWDCHFCLPDLSILTTKFWKMPPLLH
jgi:hypothetical protein